MSVLWPLPSENSEILQPGRNNTYFFQAFRLWAVRGKKLNLSHLLVLKYALLRPGCFDLLAPCNLLRPGRSRAQYPITLFSGSA